MRLREMNPEEAARIIRGFYPESFPEESVAMATKEFQGWKALQYDQRWEYGIALLALVKHSAATYRKEVTAYFREQSEGIKGVRRQAIQEVLGKSYQWSFDGERYLHVIGWLPGFTSDSDELKVIFDHRGSTHCYWSGCYVETFPVSSMLKHVRNKSLEPFNGTIKIVR